MKPLQIRLTAEETDIIVDALRSHSRHASTTELTIESKRLAQWLEWRRVKMHGPRQADNNNGMWPVIWKGEKYYANSECFECGVPFDTVSPACPHQFFDRHPRH